MTSVAYIKLLTLVYAVSISCGEFSYHELVQHTPAQRPNLQIRLLGHLSPIYRHGYEHFSGNPEDVKTIHHRLTGAPSVSPQMPFSVEIEYLSLYSSTKKATTFALKILDSFQNSIARSSIVETASKTYSADGTFYWNVIYPPTLPTNPMSTPDLMRLHDAILIILNVTEHRLTDSSWDARIARNFINGDLLPLRVLGAYMHGQTYYEALSGYVPSLRKEQLTAYRDAQQLLYNLTFSQVCNDRGPGPEINRLKELFPQTIRFSTVVLELYKGARNNNAEYFGLLEWLKKNCLHSYSPNSADWKKIHNAQQLVLATTEFHKKYAS